MINNAGLNRVIALLNTELTVIAVGTGAAPGAADEQLTTELIRKLVSESTVDGFTLIKELYLDTSEGNGALTELGLLGEGADATPASGKLFASGAASTTKTDTQTLTVSFEIEVKEVTV